MAVNPLVPVPEGKRRFVEDGPEEHWIEVADGYLVVHDYDVRAAQNLSSLTDYIPAICAALLHEAGLTTYRVIDLGGELPEVEQVNGQMRVDGQPFYAETWDSSLMTEIRRRLAVLQARAATPRHDPADIAAVSAVLDRAKAGVATTASEVLDALAAARADRGES